MSFQSQIDVAGLRRSAIATGRPKHGIGARTLTGRLCLLLLKRPPIVLVVEIETERLRLRAWGPDDFEDFARISADPEVMRYIASGLPATRSQAWRAMALFVGHWCLRGYGLWAAEARETGKFIGRSGLWKPEGWPGLEVGWLLDSACWGRGLATEGARAALEHAFTTLGADHVISVINPEKPPLHSSGREDRRTVGARVRHRRHPGPDLGHHPPEAVNLRESAVACRC